MEGPETGFEPSSSEPTAPSAEQASSEEQAAAAPPPPAEAPSRRKRRERGPAVARESIIDSVTDLIQTAVDFMRQEVEDVVREKVALPLQKVGLAIASAGAAGCLAVIALFFIAIGLVWALGDWIGFPAAFLLIGGLYLIGSVVFVVIRARVMLRDTKRPEEGGKEGGKSGKGTPPEA